MLFANDIMYAVSRLRDTFLLPKGALQKKGLCSFIDVIPGANFSESTLITTTASGERVEANSQQFLYTLPPLGFTQLPASPRQGWRDAAVFLSRIPLRNDWRQGLRGQQLYVNSRERPVNGRVMLSEYLTRVNNMLLNKYPSLESVLCSLEEEGGSWALSKNFRLDDSFKLYYQSYPESVGKVDVKDRVKLLPRFEFLKDQLNKEVG